MPWHRVNSRVVGVDSGVIGVDSGVVGVDSGVVGGICHGAMAPWHLCCNCYNNAMAFAMAPWHLCYKYAMACCNIVATIVELRSRPRRLRAMA